MRETAHFHGYCLVVEMIDDGFRGKVIAPNGQLVEDDVLLSKISQKVIRIRAELLARKHAKEEGTPLPQKPLPNWVAESRDPIQTETSGSASDFKTAVYPDPECRLFEPVT